MEGDTLSTFDKTEGFYDCISSNLPPRAMRYSMENKNNLKEKGSIYVGLGTERTTTINVNEINVKEDGTDETQKVTQTFSIPETGIITPPEKHGTYVLVCRVSSGNIEMGWVEASSFASKLIVSGIKDVNDCKNIND